MLGRRFHEALVYATQVHASQTRKGSDVPYVAHLLAVCSLVLEDGGDEDQAIAALLHDAPEDQGGAERLDDIRRRFGPRVGAIVEACTETVVTPKPPWEERKRAYLDHLHRLDDEGALRVSLADKLHNARSMLADHRRVGDALFDRFNAAKDAQRWYYEQLVAAFAASPIDSGMVDALATTVAALFPPLDAATSQR